MSPNDFDPGQLLEIVRKEAWNFVGEIRNRSSLPSPVFQSDAKLYYLETCVWNLVTLVSAATYHTERVFDEIEQTLNDLNSSDIEDLREQTIDMMRGVLEGFSNTATSSQEPRIRLHGDPFASPKAFSQRVRISIDSGPILFEFNAFLVAVRSALDYMARTLSIYIKGTDFRSIHKLCKSLRKNHPHTNIAQFISTEWDCWIELLKLYRDAITHNIVLNFTASRELSFEHVNIPIEASERPVSDDILGFYIYKEPPKFRYKVVGMEDILDQELPVIETNVSLTVNLPDGTSTVVRRASKRVDTTTVMPLKQYLVETLRNMQRFVSETFALLEAQRGQFLI